MVRDVLQDCEAGVVFLVSVQGGDDADALFQL